MSGTINPEAGELFWWDGGGRRASGGAGRCREPRDAGGAGSFSECWTEVLNTVPGCARRRAPSTPFRASLGGCPHMS